MSAADEDALLAKFATHHGVTAGAVSSFVRSMTVGLEPDFTVRRPSGDPETCVSTGATYEAAVTHVETNTTIHVPWMTRSGHFVYRGQRWVPLHQDTRSRSTMFVSARRHPTNGSVAYTCETRFPAATNAMKIVLSDDLVVSYAVTVGRAGTRRWLATDVVGDDNTDAFAQHAQQPLFSDEDEIEDAKTKRRRSRSTVVTEPVVAIVAQMCDERRDGLTWAYVDAVVRATGACAHELAPYLARCASANGRPLDAKQYAYFVDHVVRGASAQEIVCTVVCMAGRCVELRHDRRPATDRDHCGNKTMVTSGEVVRRLMMKGLRKPGNAGRNVRRIMNEAFGTGTLRISNKVVSSMIVQLGSRNALDGVCTIRKVTIPIEESVKGIELRRYHPSSEMFLCVAGTPEGGRAGLTREYAATALTTGVRSYDRLLRELRASGTVSSTPTRTRVVWDGVVVGYATAPASHVRDVVWAQKRRPAYRYVSASVDGDDVDVRTRAGRLIVPMVRIAAYDRDVVVRSSWRALVESGIVEYVDPLEMDEIRPRGTHRPIHPSAMFGLAAGLVPYANHQPGARTLFGASMVKQALHGLPGKGPESGKTVVYAGYPLVSTAIDRTFNRAAYGMHAFVLVACARGYNIEDAVVLNERSVHMGFLAHRNRTVRLPKHDGDAYVVTEPGGVRVAVVSDGMQTVHVYRGTEVDGRAIVTDKSNDVLVGGKIAARSAQKGVNGRMLRYADLPFDQETGTRPDIIFNPHGYPTRMTISQAIEMETGLAAARTGRFVDGTPFRTQVDTVRPLALRTMVDPHTGTTFQAYMGLVYYQKLPHDASSKLHARSGKGPRNETTHQPLRGRAADGGMRMGVMERDALIAHGASRVLAECTKQSDESAIVVCATCGVLPIVDDEDATADGAAYVCDCDDIDDRRLVRVRAPHSTRLLKDTLEALDISMTLQTVP